jgi:Mor family transcriptional regulator
MSSDNNKNRHSMLQTVAQAEDAAVQLERDFMAIVREEIGMNAPLAGLVARMLVDGLRSRMGGQELYIPAPDRSERDESIRREFNGTRESLAAIMQRTGLSRASVYAIVNRRPSPANSPASTLETGRTPA